MLRETWILRRLQRSTHPAPVQSPELKIVSHGETLPSVLQAAARRLRQSASQVGDQADRLHEARRRLRRDGASQTAGVVGDVADRMHQVRRELEQAAFDIDPRSARRATPMAEEPTGCVVHVLGGARDGQAVDLAEVLGRPAWHLPDELCLTAPEERLVLWVRDGELFAVARGVTPPSGAVAVQDLRRNTRAS